jgi:hypothetical protein
MIVNDNNLEKKDAVPEIIRYTYDQDQGYCIKKMSLYAVADLDRLSTVCISARKGY